MLKNKMKINEMFESIQGEGRYAGKPAFFVRLSGCNRKCSWCDTNYHTSYENMSVKTVIEKIKNHKGKRIVFTGGEPLLQKKQLLQIIDDLDKDFTFDLETNGDLIETEEDFIKLVSDFNYICISPKTVETALKINNFMKHYLTYNVDIKVVYEPFIELGKDMLVVATMIMPFTWLNTKVPPYYKTEEQNKRIEQEVWNYCVKNNIQFCLRQHQVVWGNEIGK